MENKEGPTGQDAVEARLKPCPFCGGHNVGSEGVVHSSKGVVWCSDCGTYGPHPSYDDTGCTWNTRASRDDEVKALRDDSSELRLLRDMHSAVSDYFAARAMPDFAELEGGLVAVRGALNRKRIAYEGWIDENTSDDCRDRV